MVSIRLHKRGAKLISLFVLCLNVFIATLTHNADKQRWPFPPGQGESCGGVSGSVEG